MGKKGIVALVVAASLLCSAGLVGFLFLVKFAADRRQARETETQAKVAEERTRALEAERAAERKEVGAAFSDPQTPTQDEVARLSPIFHKLGRALEAGDTNGAAEAFDVTRMMTELEQIGTFDQLPARDKGPFKRGMQNGINNKLGQNLIANELFRWTRTDIHHVRWSSDRQEVVVIAVHRSADMDDLPHRIRWWLVRRAEGWKIYDVEDLHLGLRFTRLAAVMATPDMIQKISRNPQEFQTAITALRETFGLLAKGDVEGGDKALAPARGVKWPKQMQAVIELAEGMILLGRGDAAGALDRIEIADRLLPEMPVISLARARAYLLLGRHAQACAAVSAYQKELGPDALSCTLEGEALEAQGKNAAAAAAFRRALDEAAESTEAFDGLRRVLPDAQKKELGDRLARVKEPQKIYDELVRLARADGDEAAANALLDGLLKAKPDDVRVMCDNLRRQVREKKFAEASKILKRGLEAKTRDDRLSVLNSYLFAMLGAGKPLEAYATVPAEYADHAFHTLADELEDRIFDDEEKPERATKQLTELIEAHRERSPNDPWLWFFEGAILQNAKEYEKAEKTFAAGAAKLKPLKPDDPDERSWDADGFRARRVLCFFKLKKGLEAYRDIGPAKATFQQLAGLYDMEKNDEVLSELIALHGKSGISDPERRFWQAHILYRKEEYARAALTFDLYLTESDEKAPNRWRARDELLRALLRSDPAEAQKKIADIGPDKVSLSLRAAVAAAAGDRKELERLLAESIKSGNKSWFYTDEDFRRFINQDRYRDLRTKYPNPNPPPKQVG